MHQAANALLAVLGSLAARSSAPPRRPSRLRVGFAVSLVVFLGLGAFAAGEPATTAATLPVPILPLTQAAFETTVSTDRGLTEPVTIRFSAPMDGPSVAAALTVTPDAAVDLRWAPDATSLTIAPRDHWPAGVLETVTVQAGALARTGQPLTRPARAAFLTRGVATGTAVATEAVGSSVALTTGFVVTFDQPVDGTSVPTAIRLDPPTPGIVRSSSPTEDEARYTFQPLAPLRPDVDYRLIVSGVRDADGVPLDTIRLTVHTARTARTPGVVRFRPVAGAADVAPSADLSVRFNQPMDRRSTARAFSATAGGKAISGTVRWAERDTVLVLSPATALPAGKTISLDVSTAAKNTAGVHLVAPGHAVFTTAKAGTTPAPTRTNRTSSTGGGGSAVGGGSWAAVETYYLGLMNCTRTGGWVTSTGACSSPGGRNVAPLTLDSGISSTVSRPYAKKLAVGGDCSHFIGGNPGDRLRHAGYSSYRWAENLGCRSGSAKAAVLGSHLFFQDEKSTLGGHYVNLMNAAYDRVGIGVWVSGGRVRLVVDFYHP